jgi:sulfite exporter TauE/SafE
MTTETTTDEVEQTTTTTTTIFNGLKLIARAFSGGALIGLGTAYIGESTTADTDAPTTHRVAAVVAGVFLYATGLALLNDL